ncbi:MAG: hypothetical protein ACE5JM_08340 [Armatimonadota bacterium]
MSAQTKLRWLIAACIVAALLALAAAARGARTGAFLGQSYHNITELRYPGGIRVQAGHEGVVLRSGGSRVIVDKKGNITIQAAKDITISARGDLHLSADHVTIDEKYPAEVASANAPSEASQ